MFHPKLSRKSTCSGFARTPALSTTCSRKVDLQGVNSQDSDQTIRDYPSIILSGTSLCIVFWKVYGRILLNGNNITMLLGWQVQQAFAACF